MMRRAAWVALSLVVFVLTSCGGADDDETVLVMAAASLTDAFAEIEEAFEAANPEIDVQLNMAGSSALREQILQGAPADVFASANTQTMQAVVDAQAAQNPAPFARNALQIAIPAGNPGNVSAVEDLAEPALLIGLCGEQVPCGQFARQALDQIGVVPSIDTNEGDVRSLVTKIDAGELDAGIVYRTDIESNDGLQAIALPAAAEVDITYPIAALSDAPNPQGAAAFVAFVLSPDGQSILQSYGFGAP